MSQTSEILNCLKSGVCLTSFEALQLFGCSRLAARINELRKEHDIPSKTVITSNGKAVSQYWYGGKKSCHDSSVER